MMTLEEKLAALRTALKLCLAELERHTGWSGSAGNWPLHDAVSVARKALEDTDDGS
jgi:hypothetical protein